MKDHLGRTDLAIWIVLLAGQVVLCLSIFKKGLFRKMPWFSLYACSSTAESVLLLTVAFVGSYATYYYVFYVTSHLISMMAFATLIECGRRVLPGLNLPEKEKAFGLLFLALAALIAFIALWPLRSLTNEKRIELGAYLGIAVSFIFIAAYSRYLRLSWSRLLAGVCSSLGFLYLVQGTAKAMIGHYPSALVLQVRQLSQIANIVAVLAWIVVILSPWGVREYTESDILKIEAAFARIEAGLGTKEVHTV